MSTVNFRKTGFLTFSEGIQLAITCSMLTAEIQNEGVKLV